MDVYNVEVICVEALQAALDGAHDEVVIIAARREGGRHGEVRRVAVHVIAGLGGDCIAETVDTIERETQNLLGAESTVECGGVKEVDALTDALAYKLDCVLLLYVFAVPAHFEAAQAELCDSYVLILAGHALFFVVDHFGNPFHKN